MFTDNYTLFLLLLQTPRAPKSRHPTCVVIHGADCPNSVQCRFKNMHLTGSLTRSSTVILSTN